MTPAATTRLLCHFAFWFGLLFATPVFLALHNVADLGLDPARVARLAGGLPAPRPGAT